MRAFIRAATVLTVKRRTVDLMSFITLSVDYSERLHCLHKATSLQTPQREREDQEWQPGRVHVKVAERCTYLLLFKRLHSLMKRLKERI